MTRIPAHKIDRAHTATKQLRALLCLTYGQTREAFQCLSDEVQENIMWLASDLANEIEAALSGATIHSETEGKSRA